MKKARAMDSCCPDAKMRSSCRVDAVVSVDDRGQMVLPKEIRDRANISPGDKLALITWESEGKVCCISIMKADEFGGTVKEILGPMMKEMTSNRR